jgi:RNA polymerase sigma-70 factor (ECF subfamily)
MAFDPSFSPENTEHFLRELSRNERWLRTYVFSLVSHSFDAEDILQEVKLTLWRQFANFEAGTNFRAWARTIALHQILNFRRSRNRQTGNPLEEKFVEALALELDRQAGSLERQAERLAHCLQKLPPEQRNLVLWRYFEDCSIGEIALRARRSTEAVYRSLSRIRETLAACLRRFAMEVQA